MIRRNTFVLSTALAAFAAAAQAATPAQIEVQERDGFTRLIIVTPDAARFNATLDGDQLSVRFEEEVEGDFLLPVAAAPNVFLASLPENEGGEIVYRVPENSRLHYSQSMNVIAIDVLSPDFSGQTTNIVSERELQRDRMAAFFADHILSIKPARRAWARPTAKPLLAHLSLAETSSSEAQRNSVVELEKWRARARNEGFLAVEEGLLSADASEETLTRKQDLAYFYFSQGLGPEALKAIESVPGDMRPTNLSILEGVIDIRLGRWDDAIDVLERPGVADESEALAWRALAYYHLGAFKPAWRDFKAAPSSAIPFEYGAVDFLLAKADTAIRRGNVSEAKEALEAARARPIADRQRDERRLIEARLMVASGKEASAASLFQKLASGPVSAASASAGVDAVRLAQSRGDISARAALRRLGDLSLIWRGDAPERELLNYQTSLLEKTGQIAPAMTARRRLIAEHAKSDAAQAAIADQRNALAALFNDTSVAPTIAATAFYENIEFAPPGREGDALIQHAADTLVALDLLEPASELLKHQVYHRLRGRESAKVGAHLADLMLKMEKPREAIDVLEATSLTRLPDALDTQRTLIAARARAALDDDEGALRLLAERNDRVAISLRAGLFAKNGEPEKAAALYLQWLGSGDGLLDDDGEEIALRAAAIYVSLNDRQALKRLLKLAEGRMEGPEAKALLTALASDRLDAPAKNFIERFNAYFGAPPQES